MEILFSYDSKLMQTLTFVADLILLNILYLLCCVPMFTIGAAQGALWLCGYFSLALLLNFLLMKKPFQKLIDQYRQAHPDKTEPSDEPV